MIESLLQFVTDWGYIVFGAACVYHSWIYAWRWWHGERVRADLLEATLYLILAGQAYALIIVADGYAWLRFQMLFDPWASAGWVVVGLLIFLVTWTRNRPVDPFPWRYVATLALSLWAVVSVRLP